MKLTWNKSALADMAYDAGARKVEIQDERITARFSYANGGWRVAEAFAKTLCGMGFYALVLGGKSSIVQWRVNEAVTLTGERITTKTKEAA